VAAVRLGVPGLQRGRMRHLAFELLGTPALLARVVDARDLDVLPLALARRVVHQRDQRHARMAVEGLEQLDGVGRGQLAAHVQVVVRTQQVFLAAVVERGERLVPGAAAQALGVGLADAQRVEDGGDAGGGHLGVVRQQRGHLGPLHLRARHQVALEVVGVHLDQAGQQVVALEVDGGHAGVAVVQRGDAAVHHRETALHQLVRQHHAGVGEHHRSAHWRTSAPCAAVLFDLGAARRLTPRS
jgi:hypothetical protein